jgi:hypothetical protein
MIAIKRCKRATIRALTRTLSNVVAQASKPAVSPVSKPAGRGFSITERNVFALVLSWGPPLLLPNHPEISGSSFPTSNQLEEQLAAHEYSN